MFEIFNRNIPQELSTLKKDLEVTKLELRYSYVLQKTLLAIVEDLDFEKVSHKIVDLIVKDFDYAAATYFNLDKERNFLYSHTVSNTFVINEIVKRLGKAFRSYGVNIKTGTKHLVLRTLLENKIFQGDNIADFVVPTLPQSVADLSQKLLRIKQVITLPVATEDEVFGVIMFASRRKIITDYEKESLQTFTKQIALSIKNALLFTQVQSQVTQLTKQNQDLASLFNLTSRIGQTLEPAQVAQTAVDSLPQDKTMIGAVLTNYIAETNILEVKAVTQNQFSYEVKKVIGDFGKYGVNLNDPKSKINLAVKVKDTGLPQYSDNLADVLAPMVPATFIPVVAKILQIKSVVVYPLVAKNKFIGTITYFLKEKNYSILDENEKQLLSTYTYQISIALENANLYRHSQEIQESLEKALSDLQAARKHEQDMIDIMGHELRTPMSVVRNALNMMDMAIKTQGSIPEDKQKRYVEMGLESARREVNLIETLLSATKTDSKGFQLLLEKVDLGDVVHDSLIAFKRETERKGIQLKFEKPEEDVFIYADRTRMQEIADNFISNAIKYTEHGEIKIEVKKDKQYGYLSVTDTGIGISEEDLQKLGTKFFRAKQYTQQDSFEDHVEIIRPGGTGLGLYVTFNLIRLMDGTLDVKSVLGKGSTFMCGLPVYADQSTIQVEKKVQRSEKDQPF